MSKKLAVPLMLIVIAIGILIGFQQIQPQLAPGVDSLADTSSLDPKEALLAFAQCMRDNGIPNFPDPVDDGISLSGTGIDRNTREFKAAQKVCDTLLPQPSSNTGENSAWQKILPGGDCECADGSEFAFWEHRSDATKVVFYLDGGGICFDATSCANQNTPTTGERAGPDYDPNIDGENPAHEGGMFDFTRADNPFHAYSFI